MSIFLDFKIMIMFTSMIGFAELLCYITASKKCQLLIILNMAFTLDMPSPLRAWLYEVSWPGLGQYAELRLACIS